MSRILLIDDDPQINEVVKATLEVLGHVVAAIEDADQSQRMFSEFRPDLTLVDYSLPGRTGLELLKEIGRDHPGAIRFLATGMADFGLLKKAMAAGAFAMLCKPYRMSDLSGLLETAALLEAAMNMESAQAAAGNDLQLECPSREPVRSDDLARLMAFAHTCGCDDDVALRRLPVAACELMRNAATHGSESGDGTFTMEVLNHWRDLEMRVRSSGPAFPWERAIARARAGMNKSRASGLQLVLALTDDLHYEDDGRVACARILKRTAEDPS